MGLNSYRALRVWQLGMELAKGAYLLTKAFPKHETYGLSSQLQRAAELEYCTQVDVDSLLTKCGEESRMLTSLRRSLKTKVHRRG
jgi:hypothetical protein